MVTREELYSLVWSEPMTKAADRFQEKWQRFSGSKARQNKDLDHFSGSTEP
jgi:hypothetical protein